MRASRIAKTSLSSRLLSLVRLHGLVVSLYLLLRRPFNGRWTLVALLNTLLHLMLMPSLLFLPLALGLRRWRLALLQLPPFLTFAAVYGRMFLPRHIIPNPQAKGITVATYNLHAEEFELDPMIQVIRTLNADILALQELSIPAARCLEAELADKYPYRALHPRQEEIEGQGVLSRYPIHATRYWRNEHLPTSMGHQRVEIDLEGTPVTLYNLHPIHPGMTPERLYDSDGRRAEIDVALGQAALDPGPVLLVGDFNMTDQTKDYFHVISHYTDAYRSVGWGMGFTFPDWGQPQALPKRSLPFRLPFSLPLPLLLRLDYIFHNHYFQAVEARVWPASGGSDHHPIYAVLTLLEQ